DPTRSRLLLLLDRHELTVGELCSALQLPQSTVSRHLKTLSDEGWVSARAAGTSRRYVMPGSESDPAARRRWQLGLDSVCGHAQTAMLSAAGKRVKHHENVELRSGRLEDLPIGDAELDIAVLSLVLHFVVDPAAVCAEAARALRPGGTLLVVDMQQHEREEY